MTASGGKVSFASPKKRQPPKERFSGMGRTKKDVLKRVGGGGTKQGASLSCVRGIAVVGEKETPTVTVFISTGGRRGKKSER